jgi:CRP-like cAMP-binding protein/ribonuclease BN (tRNA processing enzyme)
MTTETTLGERVIHLPNDTYVVNTQAGAVLVNCPPETLKYLLAQGLKPPKIVLLPPDMPLGQQLGSSGFVRRGINYASIEFIMYANFFGAGGTRTRLITPTAQQQARLYCILEETVDGPRDEKEYGQYIWLRRECEAVSFYPPLGRPPFANDLVIQANLEQGGGDLGHGVKVYLDDKHFVFEEEGTVVARIPTAIKETSAPLAVAPPRPLLRQEITLQFIGGSDGFDPAGITTCFLAYLGTSAQTQATLFDTAAYLRLRLGNLGMSPNQISEVVLSHLHEDHLAGLPELLLMGQQRVRLLTSDIIYRSLLRVLGAMLNVTEVEVATLFDHYPLNPGQPIELEGRKFEAIYAIHSIPTIAVRANNLCYSGDMRYDEEWFEKLEKEGVLSTERRHQLMHFFDNASVLVQDAGGGAVHTTLTPALLKSLAAKSQRVILAHTSKHNLPADSELASQIEFASSGHISSMGETLAHAEDVEPLETLSACTLFSRLSVEERIDLAHQAVLAKWDNGQTILREGDPADDKTYIVHSGLIEVWVQGRLAQVMGRGNSIGERGVLHNEPRSSTIIARGPVEMLTFNAEVFLPVAEKMGLQAAFSRADWLWKQSAFEHLPWATLLDLALDFQPRGFRKGDALFEYGEPGHECFLLISGAIAITDPQGELVEELTKPGGFFGGRSALYKQPRNASAHAAADSEVWALPASALHRLQMVYPNVLLHLRVVESSRHGQAQHDERC